MKLNKNSDLHEISIPINKYINKWDNKWVGTIAAFSISKIKLHVFSKRLHLLNSYVAHAPANKF